MPPKKLRPILISFFILIFIGISLILLANYILYKPSVQTYILKQLSKNTKYDVQAEDIRLSLEHGIGFTARNITADSRELNETVEATSLRVTVSLKALIKGRIVPSVVFLSEPKIDLALSGSTGSPVSLIHAILEKNMFSGLAELHSATIKKGSLRIKGFPIAFENLDFEIFPHEKVPHKVRVTMLADVLSKNQATTFSLEGISSIKHAPDNELLAEMRLKTEQFPLTWLNGAVGFLKFSKGVGQANLKVSTTWDKELTVKGIVTADETEFSLSHRERKKEYQFEHLSFSITSRYSLNALDIPTLELKGPDFSVKGDFHVNFNNSDNPHIALHINSPYLALETFKNTFPSPLVPAWITTKLFPILSEGKAQLENFSLCGNYEQLKNMRLIENRHVISAKTSWKGIHVFQNSNGLPFKEVSGTLDIKDGALTVLCDHGILNKSTIKTASFHVPSLYTPFDYRLSVEGQFEFDDIKAQKKLDYLPQNARQYLDDLQDMSGTLKGRLLLGFDKNWANLRIIHCDCNFNDCTFLHNSLCLPVVVEEAVIRTNEQGENTFKGTGRWGKSVFLISGSADAFLKVKSMAFHSTLHTEEVIDFFNIQPKISLKDKAEVICEGEFFQKEGNWLAQGKINLNGLKTDIHSFSTSFSGNDDHALYYLEYSPENNLTIHDFKFHLGASIVSMEGSWGLKDTHEFDIGVITSNLKLKDLGIHYRGKDVRAKGTAACRIRLTGASRKLQNTRITGEFKAKDFSFKINSLPSAITKGQCTLDFQGKKIKTNCRMSVGQTPVALSGHLYGWEGLRGNIDVSSDALYIADFFAQEKSDFKKSFSSLSFNENLDLNLNLNASKGKWHDLEFSPLTIRCSLLDGMLRIDDALVRTENGSISLTGHINSSKGSEKLAFRSNINLQKQSIKKLHKSLEFTKDMQGILTLNAGLTATGHDIKSLVSGLNGSAGIVLEHGNIKRKRGILFKLLEVLNLQNIKKFRIPDMSTKGFSFDVFEALQCQIQSGTLKSDSIVLKCPVFNAAAQGAVHLDSQTVDLNVWVQTLETMDSIVAWVPIIGYILTEKENSPKGVIIYPYEIKGNWTDPVIKSAILKNIGPGVINVFKNILMTPGRIFKRISDTTTGMSKENTTVTKPDAGTSSNGSKKPEDDR